MFAHVFCNVDNPPINQNDFTAFVQDVTIQTSEVPGLIVSRLQFTGDLVLSSDLGDRIEEVVVAESFPAMG
jgi:hypothetical protein